MEENSLALHIKNRPAQLKEAREKGTKIIGYFPGNYVPEELIVAAGAIPLCLIDGGDPKPVEASLPSIPQTFCPFARAQIGESVLKRNPYYDLIDMLIAPITCQHLKKAAEIWEYRGDIEVFKLGIPHQNKENYEIEYFESRLKSLGDRLQAFTGNQPTDSKINSAIELYNRIRSLLLNIALTRRSSPPPISALDFVKLNHASFYTDPVFMVDVLESTLNEIRNKNDGQESSSIRLLLIGPNIARGDYGVLESINSSGGEIVSEEVFEGIRYYWNDIEINNNPYRSLSAGYFENRLRPAFMRDSSRERLNFALKLIEDFKAAGVIWYELLCCETYDEESFFFSEELEKKKIPMLILESDYGMADAGQINIRIQAFIEMIKGGLE